MTHPRNRPRLKSPSRPYDEMDFRERLLSEYQMLQGKADTIGGFRITIKGWSVAALAAAAAASSKVDSNTTLILSGGLGLLLLVFFRLEFEQVRLSALYLERAGRIERALINIRKGRGEVLERRMPVPFTANEIVFKRSKGQYAESDNLWKVAKRSHALLYMLLLCLAVLVGGYRWIEFFAHAYSYLKVNGCDPIAATLLALRGLCR